MFNIGDKVYHVLDNRQMIIIKCPHRKSESYLVRYLEKTYEPSTGSDLRVVSSSKYAEGYFSEHELRKNVD